MFSIEQSCVSISFANMKYCIILFLSSLAIVSADKKVTETEYEITSNKEPRYELSKTGELLDYERQNVRTKFQDWEPRYGISKYETPLAEENIFESPKYETPKVKSIYEGPKYEAPKVKSIYEGPKYEAPKVKSIYQGPKYEAPKIKSIYEGPKYEAPKLKSIYETSKYEAPKLKDFYEEEVPKLKTSINVGSQYQKYVIPNLQEPIDEDPKTKLKYEAPKDEPITRRQGVIQLEYQEPRLVEAKEEEVNGESYYKQSPLILGRFGLGFDRRTATYNGLMRPLTLKQLQVVGRDYWGRCRGASKDGVYHVLNCYGREA